MPDELTLAFVGIDFPNPDNSKSNRRMELLLTPPGEPITLMPEPRNPHDPSAISVWSARGVQVGYINAERAPWIGGRTRAGEEYELVCPGDPVVAIRGLFSALQLLPIVHVGSRGAGQQPPCFALLAA